jgi:hypothetical protein
MSIPCFVLVLLLGQCKHSASPVVFNYSALTPRSTLTQADIDAEVQAAVRDVRARCGIKLQATRNPLASGHVKTAWGAKSAHWRPCDQMPATGTLSAGAIDGSDPASRRYVFGFLVRHESLGHGLGLDHGGMGLMRYGPPPPVPVPAGLWIVDSARLKPGPPPPGRRAIGRIWNAKWSPVPPAGPGLYFAVLRRPGAPVAAVYRSREEFLLLTPRRGAQPIRAAEGRSWFGPVSPPMDPP